jgi:ATP-binding cassette subfamily B protein
LFLDDVEQLRHEVVDVEATYRGANVATARLVVDDVWFTYPGRATGALRGISMLVEPGEIVALVGENGSGKSTLAAVIGGLYEPDAGAVRLDGWTPADLGADSWRTQFATVFQEHVRYNLSGRDVIALGDVRAMPDNARVRAAAAAAGIDRALDALPLGFETPLGPQFIGGTDLSGGQWQRLALARALYRDAPFVILDEPTAALDPAAEAAWFDSLRSLLRGRSALVISHRFSTVRSADRIYVLSEGAVVEAGSHEQLMAIDARYARLFNLQAACFADVVTQ